jgi:hypothetical protein
MRDPFFVSDEAEVGASLVIGELEPFMGSVFAGWDYACDGSVFVTTKQGNQLTLKWDFEHHCIRTVCMVRAPQYFRTIEVAA